MQHGHFALSSTALPLAAALLITAACAPANGPRPTDDPTPQITALGTQPTAAGEQGAPLGQAGLRASIDPETGQLTDRIVSPPNLQSVEDPLRYSSEGLTENVLSNGAVRVDLQGRFMSSSYAVRQPDGSIQVQERPPGNAPAGPPVAPHVHSHSTDRAGHQPEGKR